ncbi:MAG: SpoIID/LytB domain-containing protein [Chloroflexota bacterium]
MAGALPHRHGVVPHESKPLSSQSIRRLVVVTTLASLALGVIAPATHVAAVDRPPPIVRGFPPETVFYGRGWGHGVGMSQYGARGRALAGQPAADILAHYFAGTAIAFVDPATLVRVLLLDKFTPTATAPLVAHGRGGTWSIDGVAKTFPADAKLTLARTSAGASTFTLRVVSSAGSELHRATVSGGVWLRPVAGSTVLQLDSKPSSFDTYRGILRIKLTTTARVINVVGLDSYLRGVVPVEMPPSWPTEALRAQAIAARSYAVYRVHPSAGTFDVYDDTRSQVYRGVEAEAAAGNAAIAATPGALLKSGSAVANALFHSTGGGATENNEFAFVAASGKIVAGPVSYLRGSSDRAPDGNAYDAAAPFATWKTASYTRNALDGIFGADARTAVGTAISLDLSRRGVSGRLISVTLTGSLGSKTVSGEVFRAVFNAHRPAADPEMRSTLVDTRPIP